MSKKQNTPQLPVPAVTDVDEVGGRCVVACDFADPATVTVYENGKRWGKAPLLENMAVVVGDYPLTGDYSLTAELKPSAD